MVKIVRRFRTCPPPKTFLTEDLTSNYRFAIGGWHLMRNTFGTSFPLCSRYFRDCRCETSVDFERNMIVLIFLVLVFQICATEEEEPGLQITIDQGTLVGGIWENELTKEKYYAFLNIPYAQPPIGDKRFKVLNCNRRIMWGLFLDDREFHEQVHKLKNVQFPIVLVLFFLFGVIRLQRIHCHGKES